MKIEKSNQNITPFGGINLVLDALKQAGIDQVIDNELGDRPPQAIYTFSDIILNLWSVFFCGGDVAEDINEHLKNSLAAVPGNEVANADTILRVLKKLKTEKETVTSSTGKVYEINQNDKLNNLNMSLLAKLGMLTPGKYYDFDYDNEVLKTEKYDSKRTYKKVKGYFPGMATINGMSVYFENRDGNMNVKTGQAELLERCYDKLANTGVKINRSRMDAGSYSREIVETVEANSLLFYIRANRCESLTKELFAQKDWRTVEINNIKCEVCSIDYQPFSQAKGEDKKTYRLVVSREDVGNAQGDLFTGDKLKYRSILTNDRKSTEEEVIRYYNQRGAEEKEIDVLNNDFGWSKMPFSFMEENTVFLMVMMICKNVYWWLVQQISITFPDLKPNSRIKKFIFRYITVAAKWVKRGRQKVLKIFSEKPYMRLAISQ